MNFSVTRFSALIVCLLAMTLLVPFAFLSPWLWAPAAIAVLLVLLGARDLLQTKHAIQRNYPIFGHIRWFVELIRPELLQYLFEADEEAAPFSRSQRSLVYSRAKGVPGDHAFGTLLDVYRDGYEFIGHSTRPVPASDPRTFRVIIGGEACAKPYTASVFNISAMSFGSLSA